MFFLRAPTRSREDAALAYQAANAAEDAVAKYHAAGELVQGAEPVRALAAYAKAVQLLHPVPADQPAPTRTTRVSAAEVRRMRRSAVGLRGVERELQERRVADLPVRAVDRRVPASGVVR